MGCSGGDVVNSDAKMQRKTNGQDRIRDPLAENAHCSKPLAMAAVCETWMMDRGSNLFGATSQWRRVSVDVWRRMVAPSDDEWPRNSSNGHE